QLLPHARQAQRHARRTAQAPGIAERARFAGRLGIDQRDVEPASQKMARGREPDDACTDDRYARDHVSAAGKHKGLAAEANPLKWLVGRVGIEPTTNGLRVRCSTS